MRGVAHSLRTLRRAAQNAWQTKPYSNRECTSTYRLTAWACVASGRMRAVRSAREGSIAASTEKERRPSFDVCPAHPQPLVKPVELFGWEEGKARVGCVLRTEARMYLPSMPVRAESSSSTSMISCTACGNVEIGIGAGRCEASGSGSSSGESTASRAKSPVRKGRSRRVGNSPCSYPEH